MKTNELLSEMSDWHHKICLNKHSSELIELQLEKLNTSLVPVNQKFKVTFLLEQIKIHSYKLKEINNSLQEFSLLIARGELSHLENQTKSDYLYNFLVTMVNVEIQSFRKIKTEYFILMNTINIPYSQVA